MKRNQPPKPKTFNRRGGYAHTHSGIIRISGQYSPYANFIQASVQASFNIHFIRFRLYNFGLKLSQIRLAAISVENNKKESFHLKVLCCYKTIYVSRTWIYVGMDKCVTVCSVYSVFDRTLFRTTERGRRMPKSARMSRIISMTNTS